MPDLESLNVAPELKATLWGICSDHAHDASRCWQKVYLELRKHRVKPGVYRALWERCFQGALSAGEVVIPMWIPEPDSVSETNVGRWSSELGIDPNNFHAWTVENRVEFWNQAVDRIGIRFRTGRESILDDSRGVDYAKWFPNATLNIVESCFAAEGDAIAIVSQRPGRKLRKLTYDQLRRKVNQISNSVVAAGFQPGDALAVVLPMTELSVAVYLGVVQAGCSIVSIADSFAAPEITTRLEIANAKAVFTYDHQTRANKLLPLYDRVVESTELPIIAIPANGKLVADLREQDVSWADFLVEGEEFEPVICDSNATINILFSSGTTGDPKAIPWSHLTPIKCGIDGYCHQDIRPGQVCAWPTNLGWMMGPWLIFASLLNRATIALFEDAPMGARFGSFISEARVNMLGVVPTLVKTWRKSKRIEKFDWSEIRVFSSTGESSHRDEMFYLSSLAGMKPVIEYCGGTEIGGGYVSSFVTAPNVPAAFNSPAVGLDFVLLDRRSVDRVVDAAVESRPSRNLFRRNAKDSRAGSFAKAWGFFQQAENRGKWAGLFHSRWTSRRHDEPRWNQDQFDRNRTGFESGRWCP